MYVYFIFYSVVKYSDYWLYLIIECLKCSFKLRCIVSLKIYIEF